MPSTFALTLSCIDRPGIVARISSELLNYGCNVLESQQFNDTVTDKFFMRVRFVLFEDDRRNELYATLDKVAAEFAMNIKLRSTENKPRVLIMVSKFDHCLVDLFYRNRINDTNMEIVGVVSNHDLAPVNQTMIGDTPFWKLPITRENKAEQEARLKDIITKQDTDLVVLARYMQILSDDMSNWLHGRCINIHHSFLPGFKGAKPYHQAFERGVKMIGATAHYVTADLDEGPIIAQDVEAISHADLPEDLVRKGRDIERRVLASAVRLHVEDRVIINGSKTVVFTD